MNPTTGRAEVDQADQRVAVTIVRLEDVGLRQGEGIGKRKRYWYRRCGRWIPIWQAKSRSDLTT